MGDWTNRHDDELAAGQASDSFGYSVRLPGQAYSVTANRTYPYTSVVYIETTFADGQRSSGSGVVFDTNDVLTAAHVVYSKDHGAAVKITITPARQGSDQPFGQFSAASWRYYSVDDGNDLLGRSDSAYDYAVLGFTARIGDLTGTMGLSANYTGGAVNVTGYPGSLPGMPTGTQITDTGRVTANSLYPVLDYASLTTYAGESGGPLWINSGNGTASAVGLVSTSGWAKGFSSSDITTIQSWDALNDSLLTQGAAFSSPAQAVDIPSSPARPVTVPPVTTVPPTTYFFANGVDINFYLTKYQDVKQAGVDPVAHYDQNGWKEGRDPDAFFSTSYYLAQNPDIAKAGIDPLAHYWQFGWKEGRNPSATFSTSSYLAHNPDVAKAGLNPLEHYLLFGRNEGRSL